MKIMTVFISNVLHNKDKLYGILVYKSSLCPDKDDPLSLPETSPDTFWQALVNIQPFSTMIC